MFAALKLREPLNIVDFPLWAQNGWRRALLAKRAARASNPTLFRLLYLGTGCNPSPKSTWQNSNQKNLSPLWVTISKMPYG